MFRSFMTIISEHYLYLTKVMFMLKLSKITSLYKLGDVAACRRAACVLCALHTTHMPLPDDDHKRPKHAGAILLCILM